MFKTFVIEIKITGKLKNVKNFKYFELISKLILNIKLYLLYMNNFWHC